MNEMTYPPVTGPRLTYCEGDGDGAGPESGYYCCGTGDGGGEDFGECLAHGYRDFGGGESERCNPALDWMDVSNLALDQIDGNGRGWARGLD